MSHENIFSRVFRYEWHRLLLAQQVPLAETPEQLPHPNRYNGVIYSCTQKIFFNHRIDNLHCFCFMRRDKYSLETAPSIQLKKYYFKSPQLAAIEYELRTKWLFGSLSFANKHLWRENGEEKKIAYMCKFLLTLDPIRKNKTFCQATKAPPKSQ